MRFRTLAVSAVFLAVFSLFAVESANAFSSPLEILYESIRIGDDWLNIHETLFSLSDDIRVLNSSQSTTYVWCEKADSFFRGDRYKFVKNIQPPCAHLEIYYEVGKVKWVRYTYYFRGRPILNKFNNKY